MVYIHVHHVKFNLTRRIKRLCSTYEFNFFFWFTLFNLLFIYLASILYVFLQLFLYRKILRVFGLQYLFKYLYKNKLKRKENNIFHYLLFIINFPVWNFHFI